MGRPASAPLVSIILPVFNAAPYVRQSLDSILAQSHSPVEIIVTDDASTDATPAILEAYAERVRVVRQPRNRGIYGNMNDALALARGDYVAIYHADDLYHPRIVEREVAFLNEHPDVGAAFCLSVFIDPQGLAYARREPPAVVRGGRRLSFDVLVNALLTHMNRFLRCPSVMLRADVLRAVGPFRDRECAGSADLDMWLRLAKLRPLGIVDEYLLAYRLGHGGSGERRHRLRTQPLRYLEIMERCLEDGGRGVATPVALRALESHRARDTLVRVVHSYLSGEQATARRLLREVPIQGLRRNDPHARPRWLGWVLAMGLLTRVPRAAPLAWWVRRLWGSGTVPAPRGRRRVPLLMEGENWNEQAARLPAL